MIRWVCEHIGGRADGWWYEKMKEYVERQKDREESYFGTLVPLPIFSQRANPITPIAMAIINKTKQNKKTATTTTTTKKPESNHCW